MNKKVKKLKSELIKHKYLYSLIGIALVLAFILRVWRADQIMGFYFDQGRDAKVIWDMWHQGKFFLIGPTTGIAGIFRGPFYYYLIAPFYLIGGGNPVYPAFFLAFLSVLALLVMYIIGTKTVSRSTGLFAILLGGFSYTIIQASRWLSNPTPMLLLSVLLIWIMIEIVEAKKASQKTTFLWASLAFVSGISLFHFGSSGEFFYFPALAVFTIWQRKKLFNSATAGNFLLTLLFYTFAFLVTASPLIVFDLRHDNILSKNIGNFVTSEETFKTSFSEVLSNRLQLYYGVFTSKLFHWIRQREQILLLVLGLAFLAYLPKMLTNSKLKVILLMLASPIIGFLFFQGNYGNIYDYYFTGYYLIFLLLVAIVLGYLWKNILGKMFVLTFFFIFLSWNWNVTKGYISAVPDGPETIMFGNEKWAIEWIYEDANGQPFNVDVYVPPVIPHAYDYLLTWYESKPEYNGWVDDEQLPLLYTLYEVDPPHPERLDAWMERQKGIGNVEYERKFGGITVQRRTRI